MTANTRDPPAQERLKRISIKQLMIRKKQKRSALPLQIKLNATLNLSVNSTLALRSARLSELESLFRKKSVIFVTKKNIKTRIFM